MYKQEQEGTPEKWRRARKTSKGYRLAELWPEVPAKITNDFNDLAKRTKRTVRTASFLNNINDLRHSTPYEQISPRPMFFRPKPLRPKRTRMIWFRIFSMISKTYTQKLT